MRWAGLGLLVLLAVYFLLLAGRGRSARTTARSIERHLAAAADGSPPAGVISAVSSRIQGSPPLARLRAELEKSGFPLPWKTFFRGWSAAVAVVPVAAFLFTRNPLSVPLTLAFVIMVPRAGLKFLLDYGERKSREECGALAGDLALYLRCGIPAREAVALSVRGTGRMLSAASDRFEAAVALGSAPESELMAMADDLDDRDLRLIAQALLTSRQTGSEVSTIMDAIGEAVRERAAISRDIATQTLQGRLSGRVVAALPLVFLGLSTLLSRSTVSVLLGTVPGLVMLAVALLLNITGFLWIRKILDIKE